MSVGYARLIPVGTRTGTFAPAKDEVSSARDQLVAMWKTWINTNTSRVCHCCGGKAGRVEDGGLPGPSGSAATLPLTT